MVRQRSIAVASLWIVGLTLLLSFLPLLNGLIGGGVGGYMAGSPKRGLIAALLPAVVVAIALWLLLAVLGVPIIGFFSSVALGSAILLADLGILIGAAIGGYAAQNQGPKVLP